MMRGNVLHMVCHVSGTSITNEMGAMTFSSEEENQLSVEVNRIYMGNEKYFVSTQYHVDRGSLVPDHLINRFWRSFFVNTRVEETSLSSTPFI